MVSSNDAILSNHSATLRISIVVVLERIPKNSHPVLLSNVPRLALGIVVVVQTAMHIVFHLDCGRELQAIGVRISVCVAYNLILNDYPAVIANGRYNRLDGLFH